MLVLSSLALNLVRIPNGSREISWGVFLERPENFSGLKLRPA